MSVQYANLQFMWQQVILPRVGDTYVFGGSLSPQDLTVGVDCSGACSEVNEALLYGPQMNWTRQFWTGTFEGANPGDTGPFGGVDCTSQWVCVASPRKEDIPPGTPLVIAVLQLPDPTQAHMVCAALDPLNLTGQNPELDPNKYIGIESGGAFTDANGNSTLHVGSPDTTGVDDPMFNMHFALNTTLVGVPNQPPPSPPPQVNPAQVLSQVMENALPLDRYTQLLSPLSQSLLDCSCTTTDRIAMWAAQIGEESGGLQYEEELGDGSQYEGRIDLGNTQPGDGPRFKGRGFIQITGRSNYTTLSQWAFDQHKVPTPTFFVDNPEKLSTDQYAFLGVSWYWTVARPQINQLADAHDIVGVTQQINGGQNGIDDRTARYNNALAMGAQLLDLIGDDMFSDADRALLQVLAQNRFPSRSPLRHVDEGLVDTVAGLAMNTDGNVHVLLVERLAVGYGDPQSVALLLQVAATSNNPQRWPDRQQDALLAEAILAKVSPQAIVAGRALIADWLAQNG